VFQHVLDGRDRVRVGSGVVIGATHVLFF